MDDNNVVLVTFDNDHRDFNMFEDADNGNLDDSLAEPPPEGPEQPMPVCNDAGSSHTRKRKSQEPAASHASVVTTACKDVIDFDDEGFPVRDNHRSLLVILENILEIRSTLLFLIGGKLINLILN